ncbi:hypothetical protein [Microvirga subterranea]|uniref:Uncharacterized protein n=1 Tax=Microvirga subterranea TaxID=186651 RepID=A0A370HRF7_9HYPH|nr:hypothetical protein [Microvirga subterranea]RDI60880.1 hypothetical protein DES45_102268 [Microvirga subterranea]
MVAQTLIALVLAGRAALPGNLDFLVEASGRADPAERASAARYESATREVTNWRLEAMDALGPKPVVALAALLNAGRPVVTRCVRLNNYWCIKSARWNGELATDGEGHVGFASADHGAEAAATLLRRYYLDFKRKSALDIVRRWAPAECGIATSLGGAAVLAVKGIGGTLRARYLASKRKGGSVRYTATAGPGGKPGRVSMVLPVRTPQYRVPDIMAGGGERKKPEPAVRPSKPSPVAIAMARKPQPAPKATASAAPKPVPQPQAATACAPDEQRIRNYAARMVEGLGIGPTDDLRLFEADGTPLPNLTHIMLAMSGFELGMLKADHDLVERGIQRAAMKSGGASRAELFRERASATR